jgi:hypothetical protein
MGGAAMAAKELDAKPPRQFPIDAMKIFGYDEAVVELRITLPEGWKVQLPNTVKATGPFGTYESEFSQTGRELRIVRHTSGASGILPPSRIGELSAWMREMGKDDASLIIIQKS